MNTSVFVRTVSILFSALLACGCAASLPPADPALAKRLQNEAEQLAFRRDYPAAAGKFAEAVAYAPQDGTLYRQLAEILELLQNFPGAAETYGGALERLPENHPDQETIRYRYGLALARTGELREAERQLAGIGDPAKRLDLEGFVALHAGDPAGALALFGQALEAAADTDQQARIYYHASLAHYRQDDIFESKNALFHAVNNASSPALKQHIRILFDQIR